MVPVSRIASSGRTRSFLRTPVDYEQEENQSADGKKISVFINNISNESFPDPMENRDDEANEDIEVVGLNEREINVYVSGQMLPERLPRLQLWSTEFDAESASSADETQMTSNRSQDDEDDAAEEVEEEKEVDDQVATHSLLQLDSCTRCLSTMMSTDPLVDDVGEYERLVQNINKSPSKDKVSAKKSNRTYKNNKSICADDASSTHLIEEQVKDKMKMTLVAITNTDNTDQSLEDYRDYQDERKKMADDLEKFDRKAAKRGSMEKTFTFVMSAINDYERDYHCVTAEHLKQLTTPNEDDDDSSEDDDDDDDSSFCSVSTAHSNDSTIDSEMFTPSLNEYSLAEEPVSVQIDFDTTAENRKPKPKPPKRTEKPKLEAPDYSNVIPEVEEDKPKRKGWFGRSRKSKKSLS